MFTERMGLTNLPANSPPGEAFGCPTDAEGAAGGGLRFRQLLRDSQADSRARGTGTVPGATRPAAQSRSLFSARRCSPRGPARAAGGPGGPAVDARRQEPAVPVRRRGSGGRGHMAGKRRALERSGVGGRGCAKLRRWFSSLRSPPLRRISTAATSVGFNSCLF